MAAAARRGLTSPARSAAPDTGFSLVEMLVTVALMAIAVVPILDAVRGSVRASSISYEAAALETGLVNAAEAVNRAPLSCSPGDYRSAVEGALATVNARAGRTVVDVVAVDMPACALALDVVQRVTITLTSRGNANTRSVTVVKTNV